ncbi:uncharacterized protein LOC106653595 [Trichogramma pretiosum]|uniref:uncharacterized protein LOC106653595 n=1 Tax=Trichogramma pretiosum TaxID=7493 RepID=UPI0006C9C03E|nr:uncharacterized protein LOC106653595 [Trichogramma pretiosum]
MRRNPTKLIIFVLGIVGLAAANELHARRKRYIVFPEGSSFSIALCLTIHTLTSDNIFTEGVNWGISYDLPNETKPELEPYLSLRRRKDEEHEKEGKTRRKNTLRAGQTYHHDELEYDRRAHARYRREGDHYYLQRRHRRDLYSKVEVVINAMGLDGRACVLRALCEASRRLRPRGASLVEEMLRIVFDLPLERLRPHEPEEHHAYAEATAHGRRRGDRDGDGEQGQIEDCAALYPKCSFSLLDMALGRYNAADDNHPYGGGMSPETAALIRMAMK